MKNICSLSPLPFYEGTDLRYQNHRKDYAFGNIYSLISYKTELLPFQFSIKADTITPTRDVFVSLVSLKAKQKFDITNTMLSNGLVIIPYDSFYVVKYPSLGPITISSLPEGRYFLEITIGRTMFYSDVFTVCYDVSNYLCLEYKNSYELKHADGVVDFSKDFMFKCYIDTQIGKPDYLFEETGTERMGYTFIESQVSKKIHRFTFVAPEYLCDALRLVRLCDYKKITSRGLEYYPMSFSMDVNWEEQGDLAAVECSIETDEVIVNTGGSIS